MKYVTQFGIILAVTFTGEILHGIIPLPVPASIYGLLIMLFCLQLKIVSPERVEKAGHFLLETMPIMFVPAAVGLLTVWKLLAPVLLPVAVITLLTTVIVMGASGSAAQFVLSRPRREKK